ncbi:hypothetical protein B0O80DRAFT_449480 [Mortierella sp. GBAus27b]|nr:hypothetical protein B0O80DRAFT_449480 [Mortierella sp. GBAus27b]
MLVLCACVDACVSFPTSTDGCSLSSGIVRNFPLSLIRLCFPASKHCGQMWNTIPLRSLSHHHSLALLHTFILISAFLHINPLCS